MNANASAIEISNIEIREIAGQKELRAVEELQKEVWGIPDIEVVPLSQLAAAKAAGGSLLGAFDGEDLAGFAYGFPGFEHGQAAHHSHMLAVKPEYRDYNLGAKLKLAQREFVLRQGIKIMSWTFDPLQSRNAYFNFNKLGVISDRYFINFYGEDAASFLHQNGTDRLWVTWHLASRRVAERIEKKSSPPQFERIENLVEIGENAAPLIGNFGKALSQGAQIAIEIPADINALESQSVELAFEWRKATRKAFTEAIAAGFIVENFYRDSRGGKYLLIRGKDFESID